MGRTKERFSHPVELQCERKKHLQAEKRPQGRITVVSRHESDNGKKQNMSRKIILVADSHITGHNAEAEKDFFAMLDLISGMPDADIVFLGDIFELWVSLEGYEDDCHRRFTAWCAENRKYRGVYFIEGNHEFYSSITRKEAFTESTDDRLSVTDGNRKFLFMHGDTINSRDHKYRLLRFAVRNAFMRFLLKLFSKSIGPAAAHKVRLSLKETNMEHKMYIPETDIKKTGVRAVKSGYDAVVTGHFHAGLVIEAEDSLKTFVIPAWSPHGDIAIIGESKTEPVIGRWKDLLRQL